MIMNINFKAIIKYFTMLLIGFSLLFYGIIGIVIKDHSAETLSDSEVIERARELGMVGINERILEELEKDE